MKVTRYENWRVEAFPKQPWFDGSDGAMQRACESVVADIKRHCDVSGVGVTYDKYDVCSHCGYEWESAIDEHGVPGCCDAAIVEYETEKAKP